MLNNGYSLRLEADGTWTVFDVFSGKPVVKNGAEQAGLTETEANEILDTLRKDFIESSPENPKSG